MIHNPEVEGSCPSRYFENQGVRFFLTPFFVPLRKQCENYRFELEPQ